MVSVPSRGSGFLNGVPNLLKTGSVGFPSPLGEVGSLINDDRLVRLSAYQFPSPLGEVGSLIRKCAVVMETALVVSVPSRGSGFLNRNR